MDSRAGEYQTDDQRNVEEAVSDKDPRQTVRETPYPEFESVGRRRDQTVCAVHGRNSENGDDDRRHQGKREELEDEPSAGKRRPAGECARDCDSECRRKEGGESRLDDGERGDSIRVCVEELCPAFRAPG